MILYKPELLLYILLHNFTDINNDRSEDISYQNENNYEQYISFVNKKINFNCEPFDLNHYGNTHLNSDHWFIGQQTIHTIYLIKLAEWE